VFTPEVDSDKMKTKVKILSKTRPHKLSLIENFRFSYASVSKRRKSLSIFLRNSPKARFLLWFILSVLIPLSFVVYIIESGQKFPVFLQVAAGILLYISPVVFLSRYGNRVPSNLLKYLLIAMVVGAVLYTILSGCTRGCGSRYHY